MTYWFRLDDGEGSSGDPSVRVRRFPVERETPRGAIIAFLGGSRFTKREDGFACPTVEEAAAAYRARKAVEIRDLRYRLDRAEQHLELLARTAPELGISL